MVFTDVIRYYCFWFGLALIFIFLKMQCPTTIVPFFGDQFFWGDRIFEKGLGPAPIPIAELSVENLSNAITFMLQAEVFPES